MYKTVDVMKKGIIFRKKEKHTEIFEVTSVLVTSDDIITIFCKDIISNDNDLFIFPKYFTDDDIIILKNTASGNSVSNPSHYNQNTMECLDFITKYKLDYFIGNAVKYIWRHKHKNGEEDLRKAVYYLSERLNLDDSWNTRNENFEYHSMDIKLLEDMDSAQLAMLYLLSLTIVLDGNDLKDKIINTLKILERYIDETY